MYLLICITFRLTLKIAQCRPMKMLDVALSRLENDIAKEKERLSILDNLWAIALREKIVEVERSNACKIRNQLRILPTLAMLSAEKEKLIKDEIENSNIPVLNENCQIIFKQSKTDFKLKEVYSIYYIDQRHCSLYIYTIGLK